MFVCQNREVCAKVFVVAVTLAYVGETAFRLPKLPLGSPEIRPRRSPSRLFKIEILEQGSVPEKS